MTGYATARLAGGGLRLAVDEEEAEMRGGNTGALAPKRSWHIFAAQY